MLELDSCLRSTHRREGHLDLGDELGVELPGRRDLPSQQQPMRWLPHEHLAHVVRVLIRVSARNRVLLLLPRLALLVSAVALLVLAWRSRVYVAFWVFGLPLARWLFGQGQLSLLIAERTLEPKGTRLFRAPLGLQRAQIQAAEIGKGGPLQLFQRADCRAHHGWADSATPDRAHVCPG